MNINRMLWIALASLCLFACNKNNPDFGKNKEASINVTAAVEDQATRAGYDSENLPETFYLTVIQDENNPESRYNYLNEKMIKAEGQKYTTSTGANLLWKGEDHSDVKVNAYTTDDEEFSVLEDQTTAANLMASDLLGAFAEDIQVVGDELQISFHHMLCKLNVSFTWSSLLADAEKEITSVVYSGFGADVLIDRDGGTVEDGKNVTDITAFLTTVDAGYHSEAVFAPQTSEMAILISGEVNGEKKDYVLNLLPPTEGFIPGNSYTMTVQISANAAINTNVTIQEWVPENLMDGIFEQVKGIK